MDRFLQRPGSADLTRARRLVTEATALEQEYRQLTDAALTEAVGRLRERLAAGRSGRAARQDLVDLCGLGREAARRALGERPYDTQLLAALCLLEGFVVEQATGEGKTLSGALAAAGYALRGRSVRVLSVNDYLARRDAEWMGPLYALLGVSVGAVEHSTEPADRVAAYARDVVYVSVHELGFDTLRDRRRTDPVAPALPGPDVALVDEADAVLVDEARVPLVLAGAAEPDEAAPDVDAVVRELEAGLHYETGSGGGTVYLTDAGTALVEKALDLDNLYTDDNAQLLAQVNVALHAHTLLTRDIDYLVRDRRIDLIDSSRGRVAQLRRWPDGLQAAVERKEGLSVSENGEVLDSITVQALLRRYQTVCGMTGTAVAVGEQLREFYGLDVAVVEPNVACVRVDHTDRLYLTADDKRQALVAEVERAHATGRPVLIGTQDVAESEELSEALAAAGVDCVVLNARNDAAEAAVIAEAGRIGAVTVSTQMAGRGTDIRLGGSGPDSEREADRGAVAELGGLYVIGTGRHPTSRLDDQLRGRAGRQGDPGESVFFTSLEDDLVTRYVPDAFFAGSDREDGLIDDRRDLATFEHAQRVAEGAHLTLHRTTWRYSQLVEDQRDLLLGLRHRLLTTDHASLRLAELCPEQHAELLAAAGGEGATAVERAARAIVLHQLDRAWTDHLGYLTYLREGIHLRGLAGGMTGAKPLDEYNRLAGEAFAGLTETTWAGAVEAFETLTPEALVADDEGFDLAAAGLQRPGATWTYLVDDNPFGSPGERALRGLLRTGQRETAAD